MEQFLNRVVPLRSFFAKPNLRQRKLDPEPIGRQASLFPLPDRMRKEPDTFHCGVERDLYSFEGNRNVVVKNV